MKLLILLAATTVISIIGIIGTVDESHAQTNHVLTWKDRDEVSTKYCQRVSDINFYGCFKPFEITIQLGDSITLNRGFTHLVKIMTNENGIPDVDYFKFDLSNDQRNGYALTTITFDKTMIYENMAPPHYKTTTFKIWSKFSSDTGTTAIIHVVSDSIPPTKESLQTELSETKSNYTKVKQELNTCNEQIINKQIILNNTINNFNNLTLFYGTLNTEFTALETNFNIQSNDFNTCKQERTKVKQELTETKTDKESTESQLKQVRKELQEKEQELTETKSNYTKVKQELTERKVENEAIIKYLIKLNSSLNTHTVMTTEYIDTQIIDKTQTNNYNTYNLIFGYISSKINFLQTNLNTCNEVFDIKNDTKNMWKERWKTCFDKKENLKTELNHTKTN